MNLETLVHLAFGAMGLLLGLLWRGHEKRLDNMERRQTEIENERAKIMLQLGSIAENSSNNGKAIEYIRERLDEFFDKR